MEKICNDKFFDLVRYKNKGNDKQCEHGAVINTYSGSFIEELQRLLNEHNSSHQYCFTFSDRERFMAAGDHSISDAKEPDVIYNVIWGNTAFNVSHHNGDFDSETRFTYTYGIFVRDFCSYFQNHIIEANIIIVSDRNKKFDVKACRDFYEKLEAMLDGYFDEGRNNEGECIWHNRPSYILEEEAAEKAKAKAEMQAEMEEERAREEADANNDEELLAAKEAALRLSADACYCPPTNYVGEEPVGDTPKVVAVKEVEGNLFDGY